MVRNDGLITIDTLERPKHVNRGAPADLSWKYRAYDVNSLNLKNTSALEQYFFAHPVLACSWGNIIIIKVFIPLEGTNNVDSRLIGYYTMPFIIKSVSWLSGKVI